MNVNVEVARWEDIPLRTTLTAEKSGLTILVETQGTPNYNAAARSLAVWLAARRSYAQFYLATESEALAEAGMLDEMRKDGVGLLVVNNNGTVSESIVARNAALVITPDPTLKYGKCKAEVLAAVMKFNNVNRKDGLRDMCEIVERETETLAVIAVRKSKLNPNITEKSITEDKDWSEQINTLASATAYRTGCRPILEDKLKTDLHSFRGARNLIDHKARNKTEDKKRQMQFAERMMQGPRLVAELVSLQRKIK
jgi:hypothetical protein